MDWDKVIKRKCTHCKEWFETTARNCNYRSGTYKNKSCFKPECEEEGRQLMIQKNTKKALRYVSKSRSQAAKEAAKKRKERRERIKQERIDAGLISPHGSHKEPLQKVINEIVRYIDFYERCFMLPTYRGPKQAGHVIGVGSNDTLRYLFGNIFGEAEKSNGNQNIGTSDRMEGLRRSKGDGAVNYLKECARINDSINLDARERKEKAKLARGILKEMKEKNIIYTRRELDEMMEIYILPEIKEN